MTRNRAGEEEITVGGRHRTKTIVIAAVCLGFLGPPVASAGETIFLNNGRVLQADNTRIVGNRLRFETPTGATVSIPRERVLSIHSRTSPAELASPAETPPAQVYGNMTQQMNDQVRQEIQQGTSAGQR
jgi:hypothetical protein